MFESTSKIDMFEVASRIDLKFNYKGVSEVKDLWAVEKEEDLDAIFKALNAEAKNQKEESLLETKSKEDELTILRINIIKHIVKVRIQERKERESAKFKAVEKQKLLGILADKEDDDLRNNTSKEELRKMIEAL